MEVSVVVFPAQLEAEMTFVKNDPPNTLAEFEKALIANGLCRSRSEAKRLTQAVKASAHLFQGKVPPVVVPASDNPHPWLDASVLKAAVDLTTKAKAILGSRGAADAIGNRYDESRPEIEVHGIPWRISDEGGTSRCEGW